MNKSFSNFLGTVTCAVCAFLALVAAGSLFRAYRTEVRYKSIITAGTAAEVEYSFVYSDGKGERALMYEYTSVDGVEHREIFKESELISGALENLGDTFTVYITEKGDSLPAAYKFRDSFYMFGFVGAAVIGALSLAVAVLTLVLALWQAGLLSKLPPQAISDTPQKGVYGSAFKTKKGFALGIVLLTVFLLLFAGIFIGKNYGNLTVSLVCAFTTIGGLALYHGITEIIRLRLLLKLRRALAAAETAAQTETAEADTTAENSAQTETTQADTTEE